MSRVVLVYDPGALAEVRVVAGPAAAVATPPSVIAEGHDGRAGRAAASVLEGRAVPAGTTVTASGG